MKTGTNAFSHTIILYDFINSICASFGKVRLYVQNGITIDSSGFSPNPNALIIADGAVIGTSDAPLDSTCLIAVLSSESEGSGGTTPKWLWDAYESGATIVRIRQYTSNLHNYYIREKFLHSFEREISINPVLSSFLTLEGVSGMGFVGAIYDKKISHAAISALTEMPIERPLAIITTFNECDVVEEALRDLIEQGCDAIVIDNWSDDGTYETIRALQVRFPTRILDIQRFPDNPTPQTSWTDLISLKEEIAVKYPGRWIISSDADEFRRSPIPGLTFSQALHCATLAGANRINFTVLNYRPVDDGQPPVGSYRSHFSYFELPDHLSYFAQHRAWFQSNQRVELSASGGHVARFDGAVDFPLRFLNKHIPIRSPIHAMKKITGERARRWSDAELEKGWHSHYSKNDTQSYIWIADTLYRDDVSSFHNRFGLIFSTSLALLYSPANGASTAKMRRWIDNNYVDNVSREQNLLHKEISKIRDGQETLNSLLRSLDIGIDTPSSSRIDLKSELNSLLKFHVSTALQTPRRRGESKKLYVERLIKNVFFSNNWYMNQYPDVAISGIDPAHHYLYIGAKEGRNPTSYFNTLHYLMENPDVAASGLNPLVHFLLHGAQEGRLGIHRIVP